MDYIGGMYEQRNQPILSASGFAIRMLRHGIIALAMTSIGLFVGVLGYRELEGMAWIDALLNASMILGGMGPVTPLQSDAGKLFASFYALFSGLVLVTTFGLLVLPIVHRLLHYFHVDESDA